MKKKPPKVIRVPVKYDYAAIHPEFLKMMAEIGSYANSKYGSWAQYLAARLDGDTDPMNHIKEHWREYMMGAPYDHFEGDPRRHLAAIAYNAMMRFAQDTKFGPKISVFATEHDMWPWPPDNTRPSRGVHSLTRRKKRKKAQR
jgi:hypothetical protein